jgi:predicted acylesterase/phospholipase RssA
MADAEQGSRYSQPEKTCDIVLKGGITSGVVYPLALVSLAEKYRFSNIGGTSAGAIAAAAAAAAEYGRHVQNAGFERLAKVPDEVGSNLLSMFQPTPALSPLFDIFIAALKTKAGIARIIAIGWAAIDGYKPSALVGLLPGTIAIAAAWAFGGGAGFVAFGLLLALVGLAVGVIWRLWRAANTDLAANDFGLCPGVRQPHSGSEGFTDWLARLIEEAAGRGGTNRPLTFGDLATPPNGAPPIQLAMMTTSLMEERPYTLPFADDRRFVFRKDEWARIFPSGIMAFLADVCDRFTPPAGEAGEFYYFPDPARLPLIVGARMSLSFPGLIAGVPLWRRDFTLAAKTEQNKLRRCLFSDGGLSSNFPIHFFDHLLPNHPTFAISLDNYDEKRDRGGDVWLPSSAGSGSQLPVQPFTGLGGFLMRLVYSAKDWQDNLQSTLPGYRERIVHVVLKPDEGGLNLAMSEATIRKLVDYGQQAGTKLRDDFDLDQHRWSRFLVAMGRMEETLDEVARAYAEVPGGPEAFGNFLARYTREPESYKQDTVARVNAMLERGRELADQGVEWREEPTIRGGNIPKPPTHLRITPKY